MRLTEIHCMRSGKGIVRRLPETAINPPIVRSRLRRLPRLWPPAATSTFNKILHSVRQDSRLLDRERPHCER